MARKFVVGGETFSLVESRFTFAEADAIETASGYAFSEIMEDPKLSSRAKVVQALVWVSMKRTNPVLKFSDLNDLPIEDIEWLDDDPEPAASEAEPDPTEGGDPA